MPNPKRRHSKARRDHAGPTITSRPRGSACARTATSPSCRIASARTAATTRASP